MPVDQISPDKNVYPVEFPKGTLFNGVNFRDATAALTLSPEPGEGTFTP